MIPDAPRELHLFAGCGGGILAGHLLGHIPVCAVEIKEYRRAILLKRQQEGHLSCFPLFEDICSFSGIPWKGIDLICGGFPCQPWSHARHGVGKPKDLWSEMFRVIQEAAPPFVFCENVTLDAFFEPLRDLYSMGYEVPPSLRLGSSDIGGSQRRERWWLLASHPDRDRQRIFTFHAETRIPSSAAFKDWENSQWWNQRGLEGSHDGLASRVERTRAVGDGQIPAVAATAFRILLEKHR